MNYSKWISQIKSKLIENEGTGVVGVFDSGIGGLTVLPYIMESGLPSKTVYLGDTAHFPYGSKDKEYLSFLVLSRITDLLVDGAEYIAIACNTASIIFDDTVHDKYIRSKIIGTIECTSSFVAENPSFNKIGVIGTHYTIHSKAYPNAINRKVFGKNIYLAESAEQLLVTSIETANASMIRQEISRITDNFKNYDIDSFILGCTHYGHIKKQFEDAFGFEVFVIDPAEVLGNVLVNQLSKSMHTRSKKSLLEVYFTGERPKLLGMFEKYNGYVQTSASNKLAFSQDGVYEMLRDTNHNYVMQ